MRKKLLAVILALLMITTSAFGLTSCSQGSEYPAVVIPILNGPRMLMNRNLLYTAVTRARKCVTLVGDENTFWEMEKNQMEQSRYTTLDLWLQED